MALSTIRHLQTSALSVCMSDRHCLSARLPTREWSLIRLLAEQSSATMAVAVGKRVSAREIDRLQASDVNALDEVLDVTI